MALWRYFVLRSDFAKTLEAKPTYSNVSYMCFASDTLFEADRKEN